MFKPDPGLKGDRSCGCQMDNQCAAFTFAALGLVGTKGRCFLKSSAGGVSANAGCTSGVRTA